MRLHSGFCLFPWLARATATSHLLYLGYVTIYSQLKWFRCMHVCACTFVRACGHEQIQRSEWAHPDDTNHHGVSTAGFDLRITYVLWQASMKAFVLFCFFSSFRWAMSPMPWSWSSCSRRYLRAEWCWWPLPTGPRTVQPRRPTLLTENRVKFRFCRQIKLKFNTCKCTKFYW